MTWIFLTLAILCFSAVGINYVLLLISGLTDGYSGVKKLLEIKSNMPKSKEGKVQLVADEATAFVRGKVRSKFRKVVFSFGILWLGIIFSVLFLIALVV